MYDFERDTLTQLTFLKGFNGYPVWTPFGNRLAVSSTVEGTESIYWIRAGGGEPQRLTVGLIGAILGLPLAALVSADFACMFSWHRRDG